MEDLPLRPVIEPAGEGRAQITVCGVIWQPPQRFKNPVEAQRFAIAWMRREADRWEKELPPVECNSPGCKKPGLTWRAGAFWCDDHTCPTCPTPPVPTVPADPTETSAV